MKGLGFFFPFVDTPLNIIKIGMRMSPLGLAESLVDMSREAKASLEAPAWQGWQKARDRQDLQPV